MLTPVRFSLTQIIEWVMFSFTRVSESSGSKSVCVRVCVGGGERCGSSILILQNQRLLQFLVDFILIITMTVL